MSNKWSSGLWLSSGDESLAKFPCLAARSAMSPTDMSTPTRFPLHQKYRPDIDGLRAIAVMSVVCFHAFPASMKGGFVGVDVFFVISGFLISRIIFEKLDQGEFSFTEFYVRRIRRIFPALSVVLISCLLFGYFALLSNELNQLGLHIAAGAGFVSNLVLWSEAGYFDNSSETKPLLHLWSLGIEEQFYIFWPLLLWLAWKSRIKFLYFATIIFLASFIHNVWMLDRNPVGTFYSPLSRVWELLAGAFVAWYSIRRFDLLSYNNHTSKFRSAAASTASIAGLALVLFGFFGIDQSSAFPGYWALIPVVGAAMIITAGPESLVNRVVLSNKLFVWIGLISFPLYLWHWPLLSFGRLIYFDTPPFAFRLLAVIASIFLAWLTFRFIERPLRFGRQSSALKVSLLTGALASLAVSGILISRSDFTATHTFEKLSIKRKDEHAIGPSLYWLRGKDDWLFLGNHYDSAIAKLKLSKKPSEDRLKEVESDFSIISAAGVRHGIKTVLFLGPDKTSIYPEYLPDTLVPSATRYIDFFLARLEDTPGLTVYDPTGDLIAAKESEGILYWMTDTHWNNKGAFVAFAGFSRVLNIPIPSVDFRQGEPYLGDLIAISKLKNFPLHQSDSWDVVWRDSPRWVEREIKNERLTTFGSATQVTNDRALTDRYVWVIGDSFALQLRQYFNATFKEVRYLGHWNVKSHSLPEALEDAERKPDLIVVIRVERSF